MYVSYLLAIPPYLLLVTAMWLGLGWSYKTALIGAVVVYLPFVPIMMRISRVVWMHIDQAFDPQRIASEDRTKVDGLWGFSAGEDNLHSMLLGGRREEETRGITCNAPLLFAALHPAFNHRLPLRGLDSVSRSLDFQQPVELDGLGHCRRLPGLTISIEELSSFWLMRAVTLAANFA